MRLVAIKYSNGEPGWLNPGSVVNIRPRNGGQGSAVVPICCDREIWIDEPPEKLARRIQEALQPEENVIEVGKDGEIVGGMVTINTSEYRALLRAFYRESAADELKMIRERLAKLEGGAK